MPKIVNLFLREPQGLAQKNFTFYLPYTCSKDLNYTASFLAEEITNLARDKVDVWFLKVDMPPKKIKELKILLSPDEIASADRFHFIRDSQRYIAQHGVLRMLLAGYVGCSPRDVDIRLGIDGKPYLTGQDNDGVIHFSASRSDVFVVFAFNRIGETGVDIERIRPIPDMLEIVARHFTIREEEEINSCPESERLSLFYKFWTRKEAVLKAHGDGLLRPLDSVCVASNVKAGDPWKVKVSKYLAEKDFLVTDVEGPTDFAVAVAVAGQFCKIIKYTVDNLSHINLGSGHKGEILWTTFSFHNY